MDKRPEDFFIAIDQATKTSGWSVFLGGKLVEHGIYKTNGYLSERIVNVKKWMLDKIDNLEIAYGIPIDMVVLEDIQMHAGDVVTFKALAHLQGVLINAAKEKGLSSKVISPSTWRHSIGFKGKGRTIQKKNAKIFVMNNFGIDAHEDESEAICIGECDNRTRESELHV